jgi:hypothetical protein
MQFATRVAKHAQPVRKPILGPPFKLVCNRWKTPKMKVLKRDSRDFSARIISIWDSRITPVYHLGR